MPLAAPTDAALRPPPGGRCGLAPMLALAAVLLALPATPGAQATTASAPAATPYGPAVVARFPAPSFVPDLPALRPGHPGYTGNDELRAALHALAARDGGPRLVRAGASALGEPLDALLFSRGRGRPLVLFIGQQHGDEPAGAEALLALAQELAGGIGPAAAALERVDVLLLPRANPDGAAKGWRRGLHNMDVNRDHLLLLTPEAQAVARLVAAYPPAVVVDAHEYSVLGRYLAKFGAIQRHDLLLQYATVPNLPPALQRAAESWFREPLLRAVAAEGLTHEWYYTNPTTPGDLQLSMGGVMPDIARNVLGLRHAISFLVETRGIGLGKLHLARRVHTHLVAARSILASAAQHADGLRTLRAQADAEVAASACRGSVVVLAAQTPSQREVLFIDPATGADRPIAVQWNSALQMRPVVERPRPCGYWLAPGSDDAVLRLRALGLQVDAVALPAQLAAERWVELSRIEAARPDVRGQVEGGAAARLVQVRTEAVPLAVPAGSWYVGLDQPLANLAVAALEPDSPSSFFANHLLPDLASAARVLQPRPPALALPGVALPAAAAAPAAAASR